MKDAFKSVAVLTLVVLISSVASTAHAAWPMDKPMRFVVAWPPGAAIDTITRIIAEGIRAKFNNEVIVENKPGAAGIIGQNDVAKSAPDGYTFIVTLPALVANSKLTFKELPYDPLIDFANISQLVEDSLVLAVGPKNSAKNFNEFITYAKANPGKVQLGHSGSGSYGQLTALALQDLLGVEFTLVPYRGGPQMLADVLGQQIDGFINLSTAFIPQIEAGQLQALAVMGSKAKKLPNVPTLKELGINFFAAPWMGLQAPKGTPPAVVNQMNEAVADVLANPNVVARLTAANTDVRTGSPQEMDLRIAADTALWAPVIRKYGIKSE